MDHDNDEAIWLRWDMVMCPHRQCQNETTNPWLYAYIISKHELGDDVRTAAGTLMLKLERYRCKGLESNRVLWGYM